MTIDIYTPQGKKERSREVSDVLFAADINESLIHAALVRQLANARVSNAKVRTRSERQGGGRKPWRQKGTGRARQGSIRSAQFRKGGRVFGPTGLENHMKDMPKKQRRQALFSALSSKAAEKTVLGLSEFTPKAPKTKEAQTLLNALSVERSILIAYSEKDDAFLKSFQNIPNVKCVDVQYLNVHDILKHRHLVLMDSAIDKMESIWVK